MSNYRVVFTTIVALMLLSSSQVVLAKTEKRLAYSKKLGVDVIADGGNWCGKDAKIILKAEDATFFSNKEVDVFVVKVGKAVLPKECPEAEGVIVTGITTVSPKVAYQGRARKSDDWQLVALVAEQKQQEKGENNPVPAETESVVKNKGDLVSNLSETKLVSDKEASLATGEKEAETSAREDVTGVVLLAKEIGSVTSAEEFEVGGYLPRLDAQTFTFNEMDITILQTIDGCNVRVVKSDFMTDVFVFTSGDFSCKEGFLEGQGKVTFKNVRGNALHSATVITLNGFLFNEVPEGWLPQMLVSTPGSWSSKYSVLFHVGSESSIKTHSVGFMGSRLGVFTVDKISGITEQDILLQEDNLMDVSDYLAKVRVDNKLKEHKAFFVYDGLENLEKGVTALTVTKSYRRNVKYQIENHLKKQKEVELMKALQLKNNMQKEYEALLLQDKSIIKQKALGRYSDTFTESEYKLAAEGALKLNDRRSRWLIHVVDVSGEKVEVSFPLYMEGTSTEIKNEGWYIVEAKLSGELGETDDSGFIQPKLEEVTVDISCEQEKCNDFGDPLMMIRQKYQDPEWSPK